MLKHESKSPQQWYQATIDALLINGKQERTAQTYAREVRLFCKWLKRQPFEATEDDLRNFILYRRNDCKLSASSMRILIAGMRFFFEHVIPREWKILDTLKAPASEKKIRVIYTRQEVWRIIQHINTPSNQAFFHTLYSCGLRVGEAINLTIHDIDKTRGRIHIRNTKGRHDRFVPMPSNTYQLLCTYYRTHHNPLLIFPRLGQTQKEAPTTKDPVRLDTVQQALKRALKASGLYKPGARPHTLRHCYATHLLEAGVPIHIVQKLLGHKCIETTMTYLHLTKPAQVDAIAIIEDLMKGGSHGKDR